MSSALSSASEPLNVKGIAPRMPTDSVGDTLGVLATRCKIEGTIENCVYPISFAGYEQEMTVLVWNEKVISATIKNLRDSSAVASAFKIKFGRPILEDHEDTAWLENGIMMSVNRLRDEVLIADDKLFNAARKDSAKSVVGDI